MRDLYLTLVLGYLLSSCGISKPRYVLYSECPEGLAAFTDGINGGITSENCSCHVNSGQQPKFVSDPKVNRGLIRDSTNGKNYEYLTTDGKHLGFDNFKGNIDEQKFKEWVSIEETCSN